MMMMMMMTLMHCDDDDDDDNDNDVSLKGKILVEMLYALKDCRDGPALVALGI